MYYLFTDWNICGTSPILLGAVGLLYSYHTTHCSSRSLPFASASTNTTDPPSEEDSWNPPPVKKPKASLIKMCIENDKNAMLRSMRKVIIFYQLIIFYNLLLILYLFEFFCFYVILKYYQNIVNGIVFIIIILTVSIL